MEIMKIPDWKAHWIWQKAEPAKPNTYVYFRRSFFLKHTPEKAMCYVSADTSYRLFINGVFVGNGPVLTEPRWQSYDAYDVTDLLCLGENVIGAIAYHFGNAPTSSLPSRECGLKPRFISAGANVSRSLPSRECGLKQRTLIEIFEYKIRDKIVEVFGEPS